MMLKFNSYIESSSSHAILRYIVTYIDEEYNTVSVDIYNDGGMCVGECELNLEALKFNIKIGEMCHCIKEERKKKLEIISRSVVW